MAISNFNKVKPIKVASVTGTPTVAKALPFKITSGDDSTTGTGDIVLDWTNISSKSDIAVYDENDVLLDYYFESFDATAKTAVIWVYKSWTRDGTEQARIAYGSGPSDQSVIASTVFDKETDLEAGYLFNESSGNLLDVTSNNNDGTLNGGVTQGVSGIVDGAYSLDGSDDYIETVNNSNLVNGIDHTILVWINFNSIPSGTPAGICGADSARSVIWYDGSVLRVHAIDSGETLHYGDTSFSFSASTWYLVGFRFNNSSTEINSIIGTSISGDLTNSIGINNTSSPFYIGSRNSEDNSRFNGKQDNFFIFNKYLTQDEISSFYDATKSSPTFFTQDAGISGTTFIPQMILT